MVVFSVILALITASLIFGKKGFIPRAAGVTRASMFSEKIRQLMVNNGAVAMIDGDNVRGKTGFSFTKEQLFQAIQVWARMEDIQGRVAVYFDHGNVHEAFLLQDGCVIVFSGPTKSADDIIARDVGWIHQNLEKDVVIITEDHELKSRCRKSSYSLRSVYALPSTSFAQLLSECMSKSVQNATVDVLSSSSELTTHSKNEQPSPDYITNMTDLIMEANFIHVKLQIKQKIAEIKLNLKRSSRKRISQLKTKLISLYSQLVKFNTISWQISAALQEAPDVRPVAIQTQERTQENGDSTQTRAARIALQLLSKSKRWEPEQTWERVILAENFRYNLKTNNTHNLMDMNMGTSSCSSGNLTYRHPLTSYVLDVNADVISKSSLSRHSKSQSKPSSSSPSSTPLAPVVM